MKLALIASSYLPSRGGLERYVDQLARGIARRGAEVEIFAQVSGRRRPHLIEPDEVPARRFPTTVGRFGFAPAPSLWEHMRARASEFDIVHVHSAHPSFALAAAHAGFARHVFTPHPPIERFLSWPYVRATQAVVAGVAQVICTSRVERDLLCQRLPHVARLIRVSPPGVDAAAINAARPFESAGTLLLTAGRLERVMRVDRAIAAMPGLGPDFRLVVVGDGPDRDRLEAYAHDLQVSARVSFVGSVSDGALYRWLRTADVLVSLSERRSYPLPVIEALAAGAAVVASDTRAHHEAAARLREHRVSFVSSTGSPLDLAGAIAAAARLETTSPVPADDDDVPGWEQVVDAMWSLYQRLAGPMRGLDREHGAAGKPDLRPVRQNDVVVPG